MRARWIHGQWTVAEECARTKSGWRRLLDMRRAPIPKIVSRSSCAPAVSSLLPPHHVACFWTICNVCVSACEGLPSSVVRIRMFATETFRKPIKVRTREALCGFLGTTIDACLGGPQSRCGERGRNFIGGGRIWALKRRQLLASATRPALRS